MAADAQRADSRAIITTRLIDAPRALVFEAWTDPKHLAQWWGPNGFTTTTNTFQFKPGGIWRFVMHGPDGRDYENRITFEEITPPERILYHHGGGDDVEGVSFRASATFEGVGAKTRFTLRAELATIEERDRVVREYGADEGARQTVARLAEYMAAMEVERGEDAFVVERRFAAPRALVWRALSEAEHLARWWGPAGFTWVRSTLDFRPGGAFHYCMRPPTGAFEMWGKFVYRGIGAPDRLVYVSGFSNEAGEFAPGPFPIVWPLEVLNVLTLSEENGATRLTLKGAPIDASEEERASFRGHFASMQGGFKGTLDQLEAYLSELAETAS